MEMVGIPFRQEDYGIDFPRNDSLREQVDIALLAPREDGTYQSLYDGWLLPGNVCGEVTGSELGTGPRTRARYRRVTARVNGYGPEVLLDR